jgi:hypothetical protein
LYNNSGTNSHRGGIAANIKTITEANMFEFSVPQHVLDRVVEEYLGNELDNELEEVQCLLQEINSSQETEDVE